MMRLKKVTWTYLDLTTDFILVGTVMAALSANDDNMFASEYLLFAKQAGWVLKTKIFGPKPTYQKKPLNFVNSSGDSLSKIVYDF